MNNNQRKSLFTAPFCLMAGASLSLLSVVLGAFGAHALKNIISADMLAVYDTALRYQMFHALALLLLGLLMSMQGNSSAQIKQYGRAAGLFLMGLVLFCGSLYALALSGLKVLGAITPFGGLAFILAWFYMLLALKNMAKPSTCKNSTGKNRTVKLDTEQTIEQ